MCGVQTFREAMQMAAEIYQILKKDLKEKYGQDATNVGGAPQLCCPAIGLTCSGADEGGFAPNIQSNEEGLALVRDAIRKSGYEGKVIIGMDVAASEFQTKGEGGHGHSCAALKLTAAIPRGRRQVRPELQGQAQRRQGRQDRRRDAAALL